MELVIEFIGEIIIEGIIELIQNKKISKWIRYPLLIIISLFYALILGGIGIIMLKAFNENILIGIFLLLVEILLIIGIICIIRKAINKKDIKEIQN